MNAPVDREQIVGEVRARLAQEGIAQAKDRLFELLHPTPHHGRAALECLSADDDFGLAHHLELFFTSARAAWIAWAALKKASADRKGAA